MLDEAGLSYRVNPRLVRGLDYYGYTVFEWVTDKLGAQGTVCAGGRYNGLVEQLGGKPTPAVGFAMGVERLVLLTQSLERFPESLRTVPDVYILAVGHATVYGLSVSEQLRNLCPELRIQMHCGGGSFKNQMKKADKSGAEFALVLGEGEAANKTVSLKFLRQQSPQQTVSLSEAISLMTKLEEGEYTTEI